MAQEFLGGGDLVQVEQELSELKVRTDCGPAGLASYREGGGGRLCPGAWLRSAGSCHVGRAPTWSKTGTALSQSRVLVEHGEMADQSFSKQVCSSPHRRQHS